MIKWKIVYWSNLNKTEWIIKASTKEEARKKILQEKGNEIAIIQICETDSLAHN